MAEFYIVGGANIDLCGKSSQPLQQFDSNPGKISLSFGGVGRNIAENLCRFQEKVHFISVFGQDPYGDMLMNHCQCMGMDTSFCKRAKNHATSTYLAILDENQDMALAISDMDILNEMDEAMLDPMLATLDQNDVLIVDTNLDQQLLHYIVSHAHCTVAIDPISVHKAIKIKPFLSAFDIFKPNRYEAEELWGHKIESDEEIMAALDYFRDLGIQEVLISLSSQGVAACNKQEKVLISHPTIQVVNATGGGDSFLAAYLCARKRKPFMEAVEYACAAAINTIRCLDTVDPKQSDEAVLKTLEEIKMERKLHHVYSSQ